MKSVLFFGLSIITLFGSCARRPSPELARPDIPSSWPPISQVEDNPWDPVRAGLGKELFFEPKLSRQGNISCGTCHQPDHAWTVEEALVMGTEGTRFFRHPPSLLNVGFFTSWHWDGGTTSLEKQVLAPLENPDEMNMRLDTLLLRLRRDTYYSQRFNEVFGKAPDMYGITRALGAYQRSLISAQSKWDQVQRGLAEFSSTELRGEELFFSDNLACSSCHTPPLFTDLDFHNTGIWSWGDFDPGRSRVTLDSLDRGKFKTPTLRNLAFTKPYFHNGEVESLEEVLTHYATKGNNNQLLDADIKGFHLNAKDRDALLSFLLTLTDSNTIRNPELRISTPILP